jgi:hypothetical protein
VSKIEIRGITERDIDLLLLEEFAVSTEFREWFCSKVGLPTKSELVSAARSVVTSTGESDLEITFSTGTRTTRFLIENKIDAILQSRQAERYQARAVHYMDAGACDEVSVVLFAPEHYATSVSGFDLTLTYEEVVAWFKVSDYGDLRTTYKVKVLEKALARNETGWQLVPDKGATNFWRSYWEAASDNATELRMPKPGAKPATSNFIFFKPLGLPRSVKLVHKVPYGNVDLQFANVGHRVSEVIPELGSLLSKGMVIEQAHKSLVVRMRVEEVALESSFTTVKETIRLALESAVLLLQWFNDHKALLQRKGLFS